MATATDEHEHDDDEVERDDEVDPEAADDEAADDEAGKPTSLDAALELLDAERRAHSAARKESAKHRRQKTDAERELERERAKGLSDAERLAAEQKQAGRDEAELEWRDRYLREAVSAAAGGKLRDPDDAYGLLEAAGELGDLRELEPDEMRTAARARVEKLIDKKPYLAAGSGGELDEQSGARSTGVRRRMSSSSSSDADDGSAWLRKAARRG